MVRFVIDRLSGSGPGTLALEPCQIPGSKEVHELVGWNITNEARIVATDGPMDEQFCRKELKVLVEVAQTIGRALDLDEALQAVLGILADNLPMKRATITLRHGEKGRLVIKAAHGLSPEEMGRGVYGLGEGVTGLIVR